MLAARRSDSRSALLERTAGRVLRMSSATPGATRGVVPLTAGVASSAVRAGLATTGRLYGGPVQAGPYTGPDDASRGAESPLSPAPSRPYGRLRLRRRRAGRALPALRRRPRPARARHRVPLRRADAGVPGGESRRGYRRRPAGARRGGAHGDRDAVGRRRGGVAVRGRELRRRRRRRAARARPRPRRPRRRGAACTPTRRHLRRLGPERLPAQEPAPLPRGAKARERPDAPPPLLARRPLCAPRRLRRVAAPFRVEPVPAVSSAAGREHHRLRGPEVALNGVQVGRRPPEREDAERRPERERAPAVEQVGVVEVDVDERLVEAARQRAHEDADRVRARQGEEAPAGRELELRRPVEVETRRSVREVRRPERGRGAVGVAELGDRLRDVLVRVPAAAAEERRLESCLTEPCPFPADTSRRPRLGARPVPGTADGARLPRAAPVRVVAERPELGGAARTLQPARLDLARLGVRWAHEGGDPEAGRPRRLERLEACPDAVVERSFDVAGNDGVAFLADHAARL